MADVASENTPPRSLIARLAASLNESVMGFFALVAFAVALGPLVFDLSPAVDHAMQSVEWLVVGAFAIEFAVQLIATEDRAAWLRSPWRIIDVITIVGPVVALLPGISDAASGSLVLRLLRVGRAVAFGTRAGSAAARRRGGPGQTVLDATPTVVRVPDSPSMQATGSDWGACLAWTSSSDPAWFHATRVSPARFREAALAAGANLPGLNTALKAGTPARLRTAANASTIFLWIPTVADQGFPTVTRDRIAAVITSHGLLTATLESFDLPTRVAPLATHDRLKDRSFPIRVAIALLNLARKRFNFTADRFEDELRRFDSIPATEGGRAFLEETSRLRREISTATRDLGQLLEIIRSLADGRAKLNSADLSNDVHLDELASETNSLHERMDSLKEDVESVIELHINLKSFEMNKFLKLLAIVSFLGLIPSVVGGMLGMNVEGNPWPITLGQVAFCIGMTCTTALYVFSIKGWLR